MLLFKLIALSLVAFAASKSLRYSYRSQYNYNVVEIIKSYNYPVQNLTVQTSDGYIISIIRIPHGVHSHKHSHDYDYKYQENQSSDSDSHSSESMERRGGVSRPVVILMPGFLSDCTDFVVGGPQQGLAFYLADHGYDVVLANYRGTVYGRKHTTLNPDSDSAFWDFCWGNVGESDLPAIIDSVLRTTGQQKVHVIGHGQGATAALVLASEKPQYNSKINVIVGLGPISYMSHASNSFLRLVADHLQSPGWITQNLGAYELKPSQDVIHQGGQNQCKSVVSNSAICDNNYFIINGYEVQNLNETTINVVSSYLPAPGSTKQLLHFAQLVRSGSFSKYNRNSDSSNVVEYNLGQVSAPVALLYGTKDSWVNPQDVQQLAYKLPNVVMKESLNQVDNNLGLLYSNNVHTTVYPKIIQALRHSK